MLPGLAMDIGVSKANEDDASILGPTRWGAESDFGIYFWTDIVQNWVGVAEEAYASRWRRGPPGSSTAQETLRRDTLAAGGWEQISGGATDIGSSGGFVWVAGAGSNTAIGPHGDHSFFVWDEQPAGTFGTPLPRAIARWIKLPSGAGTQVAPDNDGRLWIVNSSNQVFTEY